MSHKRAGGVMGGLSRGWRRLFAERKLVIISHNRVRNVPIGPKTQFVIAAVVLVSGAWTAYSTGMTLAHQKVVDQANAERIATAMAMVTPAPSGYSPISETQAGVAAQDEQEAQQLRKRMTLLESRINELENYQQSFLETVGERASVQLSELKKIIDMTGLSMPELRSAREAESKLRKAVDALDRDDNTGSYESQGGPYVAFSSSPPRYFEKDVMDGVSQLVRLHNIYRSLPLGMPVSQGRITSDFGTRKDPLTRRRAIHYGIDFSAPRGAKVFATAAGKVTNAGRLGAYGNLVEVDHGFGVTTRYGHLEDVLVKDGQQVRKGDVVGIQGNTGRSTGYHLHYEVRYNDRPLNPMNFINAGVYALEKRPK